MDFAVVLAGVVGAGLVIALTEWLGSRSQDRSRRLRLRDAPGPGAGPRSLRDALRVTRANLAQRFAWVLGGEGPAFADRLEEALIGADVGVETARVLVERVRSELGSGASDVTLRSVLARIALDMLPEPRILAGQADAPQVIMVLGVNGVGKTTTIGKLASRFHGQGRRVLLVAGDTYRAAAGEQLAVWADRVGVDIVRSDSGATPAAVVFDGLLAARARSSDVVLVDTAGRLHTSKPLLDELRKVRRVIEEAVPGAPHDTVLVLDATTGQNALSQARSFMNAVNVSGVVLAKLDGTARGGMALAIGHLLGLPIVEVGTGEGTGDLQPFDRSAFVSALFGEGGTGALQP